MSNLNSVQLSVRIDSHTDNKIRKIMAETGQNKTQVVKKLLNQCFDIEIRDGRKIAKELFNIRLILEKNTYDEDLKTKVEEICNLLAREIYNLITKGGENSGNIKGN